MSGTTTNDFDADAYLAINRAVRPHAKDVILSTDAVRTVADLDRVAIHGRCRLIHEADTFFGGEESMDFVSPVLENPTWLTVAIQAQAMIECVGDRHHVFLEALHEHPGATDIATYRFVMGS
ncbi:hypothetical protein J2T57_001496 [Natronocella acetinitrilica]|uniref:Uncharacterized protein n=1 Tax=Natronocella acetinitrilica TaxID=414046 RepID=A0AAE3G2F8_9GAMM|nr:hypothetical protein [Natronocella acetinitrilica]MCP1674394.1 hypothetical protein [Natronocella acetinitrilica]